MTRHLWRWSVLAFLVLGPGSIPAGAGDPLPTRPAGPETPWAWVVARVEAAPDAAYEISGYFAGLGALDLDCSLIDREGAIVASGRWELVAGVPADYRLPGLSEVPGGAPLTLVVSGLEAAPNWLALSLWRRVPNGASEELAGDWIRSDPGWLTGARDEP